MSVQIDQSNLARTLRLYTRQLGKDLGDSIVAASRLVAVQFAKYTQPYGTGDDAKAKGEAAIYRDLFGSSKANFYDGAFKTIPYDLMATSHPEGTGTIRLFSKKDGTVYGTDQANFKRNPSMKKMAQHHQSMRQKSNGRVTQAGSFTRDIGRWKFIDKWVIPKSAGDRYFKRVSRLVGFAKGAWAACAKQVGGSRGIPQWITRHAKKSPGEVIDNSDKPNPSVTMVSSVHYASRVLSPSNYNSAVKDAYYRISKDINKKKAYRRNAV